MAKFYRRPWSQAVSAGVSPTIPWVDRLAESGETFLPELLVMDWQSYLRTIHQSDLFATCQEAARWLLLSDRRLLVASRDPSTWSEVRLSDVSNIRLGTSSRKVWDWGENVMEITRADPEGRSRLQLLAMKSADAPSFVEEMTSRVLSAGGSVPGGLLHEYEIERVMTELGH